jgi:hypothetical protein
MVIRNVGKDNDFEFVDNVKNLFNDLLGVNLQPTIPFHPFDLKDKEGKVVVEVKRRYIQHDAYPTLIMNWNKYIKAKQYIEREYRVFFVIHYNDGIYYHEYKNEEYDFIITGRRDRGYYEATKCANIPIYKLQKLENEENMIEYDF